jgi:hypothetical protein
MCPPQRLLYMMSWHQITFILQKRRVEGIEVEAYKHSRLSEPQWHKSHWDGCMWQCSSRWWRKSKSSGGSHKEGLAVWVTRHHTAIFLGLHCTSPSTVLCGEIKQSVIPYLRITRFRIIYEIVTHPEPLPQSLVVSWHLHLTYVTTVTLWFLTLWLWIKSGHGFLKPVDWINVEFINKNYSKKNITNATVRPFQATIIINCKILEKWRREDTWWWSWWWPCLRWPNTITQGPSATSPLPHTKPGAYVLTRKSYVANQDNICPNPTQEDIVDGSVFSTSEPYRAHRANRPKFHRAKKI